MTSTLALAAGLGPGLAETSKPGLIQELFAVVAVPKLCTWGEASMVGSYLFLKNLLLLWDDAGGMTLICF